MQGGAARHHLLDPRTGLLVASDLWTVTIVMPCREQKAGSSSSQMQMAITLAASSSGQVTGQFKGFQLLARVCHPQTML